MPSLRTLLPRSPTPPEVPASAPTPGPRLAPRGATRAPRAAPLLGASAALACLASLVGACGPSPALVSLGGPPGPDPVRPVVARAACEGHAFSVGAHSYCVVSAPLAFDAAATRCEALGGHLAVVRSAEENAAIADALRPLLGFEGRFWIGLAELTEDQWMWGPAEAPTFGAWASGEPNNMGGHENCAELMVPGGEWNDRRCDDAIAYVCEPSESNVAPFGCTGRLVRTPHGQYCFHTSALRSWDDAFAACAASGGQLAKLTTQAESDALREATRGTIGMSVYVGLTDRATEGTFEWTHGRDAFRAFGPGEPNDAGGDEDCVELFPASGKWNDIPCKLARSALCELR